MRLGILFLQGFDINRGPVDTELVLTCLVALAVSTTHEVVDHSAVTQSALARNIIIDLQHLALGELLEERFQQLLSASLGHIAGSFDTRLSFSVTCGLLQACM